MKRQLVKIINGTLLKPNDKTKKKNMLVLMVILTSICIADTSSAHPESNLQIALFGSREVNIKTFEPFDIWIEIVNPDSVGHSYRILVNFEDYRISESGYISAGGFEIINLALVPVYFGNQTIEVRLYQDPSGDADYVDKKTKNITVEKGYLWTEMESLNNKVERLEAENSKLNDITNRLTYAVVSLFIMMPVVGIAVWWVGKKRNGEEAKPQS